MINKNAGGQVASNLIDIVNKSYVQKSVPLDYEKIRLIAGVEINNSNIDQTLKSFGFSVETLHEASLQKHGSKKSHLTSDISGRKPSVVCCVPSWRYDDIDSSEDLAEEVIRLYGYYKLPGKLMTGEIPQEKEDTTFYWENIAKDYLKYQGFFECYTTSCTGHGIASSPPEAGPRNDIGGTGQNPLKISNPLSKDLGHLKTSLMPQLLEVLDKNKGYSDEIKLFELASVYLPKKNDLPEQPMRLAIVTKGINYLEHKGILEGLLSEMGISFPVETLHEASLRNGEILATEIDFESLTRNATTSKTYTPISKFNAIKEDLTIALKKGNTYGQLVKTIKQTDSRTNKISFKGAYQNKVTLAIEFLDRKKQITSKDTKEIRDKTTQALKKN